MGKITEISVQKRNKTRVSVFIDDEFVCGLDKVTAAAARLKVGDDITADELNEVVKKSEKNSAFERAVGYLTHAPRSEKEIARYLSDKGYDKNVVGEAVERLSHYGFIDDAAYAKLYCRSKSIKYGSYRIRAELKQKGISDDIIAEVCADYDNEDDNATETARKYIKTHSKPDIQKLKRFLAGRGFSWDSITSAVKNLHDELTGGDGDCDD